MAATRPVHGAERSFKAEVRKLQLGAGETFHGEAILALTKALLESGVAYVGGYPGAPVSHLMDVLADARDEVLEPLGVQFEASGSEAGAAALLGASIHYPLRGAVTWKSIVGTNVASDALSNLASAGVTGGALVVIGEDYGEGASVIQERTHATAMKSSLPLLDPRYDLPRLVELSGQSFALSEACHLPVMMSLRIRAAHMTGSFVCRDNRAPPYGAHHPLPRARFDYRRIVLPPSTYAQERDKFERRLPAARRFVLEQRMNEHFPGDGRGCGIILQGGTWGTVLRGLRLLGAADALGHTPVPLLVLNVVHPLVPEQVAGFARGKDHLLVVEEGHPALIEEQVRALLQREGITATVAGKDVLPMAGEYVADVVRTGLATWLERIDPARGGTTARALEDQRQARTARARAALGEPIPPRPRVFAPVAPSARCSPPSSC